MHNPEKSKDTWAVTNEPVYKKWGNSPEFNYFYDLVLENKYRRVYRLNTKRLETQISTIGYNKNEIPSLNPKLTIWNPSTIYSLIRP